MFLMANGLETLPANEAHLNLNLRTETRCIQSEGEGHRGEEQRWGRQGGRGREMKEREKRDEQELVV